MVDEIEQVSKLFNGDKKLNILHFNIRSLRRNFEELLIYINEIGVGNLDVIVLSETFVIEEPNRYNIDGFDIFYNYSSFNKNDGVLMYIKQSMHAVSEIIEMSETSLLHCTMKVNDFSIGVMGVYRSPSSNLNLFLDELESGGFFNTENMCELFVGDININISEESDINVNRYLNVMTQKGYVSCINEPTRVTQCTSTLLDHLFLKFKHTNFAEDDIIPIVFKACITDHYPIGLSFQNIMKPFIAPDRSRQRMEINYSNLIDEMSRESWREVLSVVDIEKSYDNFKNKILCILKRHTKIVELNNKIRKRKAWVTQGIVKSILKRDHMKKILHKNYSIENEIRYKTYRNKLNKIIKLAKINYYKLKFEESKNDYKKTWKFINKVTNTQGKAI